MPKYCRCFSKKRRSALKALINFLFIITGSISIAKECPPKDTYVCTVHEGSDKGRQVIVIQYRTRVQIRTGAIFGVVMKKTSDAPIDGTPLEGSGVIVLIEGSASEIKYRFTDGEQKRGTVVVLAQTGMGFYDFNGSRKSVMTCEAKYFAQINPHNKDAKLTDEDICSM